MRHEGYDLTILMPCLNEAGTVGLCVRQAKDFLEENDISGEVLLADNGSTDDSAEIARECGARVIVIRHPGYGCALRAGIRAAKGGRIVMADCDTTYDFDDMISVYRALGENDMVIGNRFIGGIEPGAMPISHRIGVKLLSCLGRARYGVEIGDFHSGLRGITREAAERLTFKTTGMEFATEMIAEGAKEGLRIKEVPISLLKCRYNRQSKLRTIRDGLRHLCYMIGN